LLTSSDFDSISHQFVTRENKRDGVTNVAYMLHASIGCKQSRKGSILQIPPYLAEVVETTMGGKKNAEFVKTSSLKLDDVVQGIITSETANEFGTLYVHNVRMTKDAKKGDFLQLYYSKKFAEKIKQEIRSTADIDDKLKSCRYGKHVPQRYYKCKGCRFKGNIKRFEAHINNWRKSDCYLACTGVIPKRRGDQCE
jgi:hypothetical protein